jgi:AcrR family transcriptional regulator
MTHRGEATQDKTVKRRIAKNRQTEGATGETKSSEAILLAAVDEFSERGFDGARMEAIAERAGYNKSLVYRYFTDKKGLFEAVLRHKVEQRVDLAHRMPDELAAILEFWFEQSLRDPSYLRLLIREALNDTGDGIVEEASRRAYYLEHTDAIASFQEAGRLSNEYDPAYLNLAMTALTLFPAVFPQLTRMITGRTPESRAFKRDWKRLFGQLADDLKTTNVRSQRSS